MRLDKVTLTNWMAHRHAELALSPLTIVAGGNDRGKSSIRDGIAFALLGESPRIELKADRHLLITEGESKGSVTVAAGEWSVTRNIKDGKAKAAGTPPLGEVTREVYAEILPYCLDPGLWSRSDAINRRRALMSALALPMTAAKMKAALAERGITERFLVELPDDGGPDDWVKLAETRAAEARGAWRQLTGETYGDQKAETWAPPPVEAPGEETLTELQHAAQIAAEAVLVGRQALANAEIAARVAGVKLEDLEANVTEQARLQTEAYEQEEATTAAHTEAGAKLKDLEARLPAPPLTCAQCGFPQSLSAQRTLVAYAAPANPSTADEVNEARRALTVAHRAMEDAMVTASAARRSHTDAKEKLARYQVDAAKVQDGPALELAQAALTKALENEQASKAALAAARQAADMAANADRLKGSAQAEHQKVKAWVEIRDLVSPNGIPAEMLSKALKRVNGTLRVFAEQTGWPQVAIRDDMSITSDGRPYTLCAKSRKWRADLMIAVAMAGWSKLGLVVADEADILEPAERGTLLSWLYQLTQEGIETVVVIATLQKPPPAPEGVTVHWLGSHLDAEKAAA